MRWIDLVGVVHLLDGFLTLLLGELCVAPVVQKAIMQPILVDGPQFEKQRFVKPLDDLYVALHVVNSRIRDAMTGHGR